MKTKSLKKIFFGLLFAVVPFTLSSCSAPATVLNTIDVWKKYNTLGSYIDDSPSSALKWISQRTFSLRFLLTPKDSEDKKMKYEFGTAWIYAKDDTSNFTYYLATNIHVANSLSLLTSETESYQESDWATSKKVQKYDFEGLALNFISEKNVSSTLRKNDGSMDYIYEYPDGQDNYITLLNADKSPQRPEIVYTATGKNLVKNVTGSKSFFDPKTKKEIKNPAVDFALIKVDFESVINEKNRSGISVKEFLQTYDANPTFFSSSKTVSYDNSFYLGGFPEDNQNWKPNRNVAWLGLNNIKLTEENNFVSLSYDNKTSKYAVFDNPKGIMPLISSISYVNIEQNNEKYLWYRNAANQLIIGGGSLGGGSSGSMLISYKNNQYYVVGIYWGAYEFTTRQGINYSYGAVDLLRTNTYYIENQDRGITTRFEYPSYDVIGAAGIAVREI